MHSPSLQDGLAFLAACSLLTEKIYLIHNEQNNLAVSINNEYSHGSLDLVGTVLSADKKGAM